MFDIVYTPRLTLEKTDDSRKVYFGPDKIEVIDHPNEQPYTELTISILEQWGTGKSSQKVVTSFVWHPHMRNLQQMAFPKSFESYVYLLGAHDFCNWRNGRFRMMVLTLLGACLIDGMSFGLWAKEYDSLEGEL